ncbi:MAG: EpsG family protein [Paludibacteraceae bacterium]|nr:EpsG family protein [Paludibacteraceae bacterium]
MGYSAPYLTLFGILIGIAVLQLIVKRDFLQNVLMLSVMVVFTVFFGFRGFVETDCIVYYPLFQEIPVFGDGIWKSFSSLHFEPGFLLWTSLLKSINSSYEFYMVVNTIVDLLLLTVMYNRYFPKRYYAFFVLLYLAFFGIAYEFNLLRNVKSMLLFCLSLRYVEERKAGKYMLFNLIGMLFHWSAVLYMLMYFVFRNDLSQRRYFVLLGISMVMYIVSPFIIEYGVWLVSLLGGTVGERATAYLSVQEYARTKMFSLGDLDRMLVGLLVGLKFKDLKQLRTENALFLHVYIVYLMFAFCGHGMEILHTRVANLFVVGVWVICLSLVQVERKLIATVLFLYFSFSSMFKVWSQSDSNQFMQYDNYLLDDKMISFEERERYYYTIYPEGK